jgi:glycosyltransferase involved in cell wall biosynthesis
MRFFTIVAANYLAMAASLGESLRYAHPEAAFTVFLLDDLSASLDFDTLQITNVKDVLGSTEYYRRLCFYDLLEFATCVKARCFQHLFASGEIELVYLDPDIYVFSRLSVIENNFAAGATIQLTPHILEPLAKGSGQPDDLAILRSGVYNLGFLALASSKETDDFLVWWDGKLKNQCLRDPSTGVFADQKWMEYAPVFMTKSVVIRDEAYNVAYWNLQHRTIEQASGATWLVNGRPLAFFHFSGYDTRQMLRLSKHETRFGTTKGDLADLLRFYAGRLDAHGHEMAVRLAFQQPRFVGGETWDPICRALFRWKSANGTEWFYPLSDPSFLAWMGAQEPGQPFPRYLEILFRMRPDVLEAYPDVPGKDFGGLLSWLENSGPPEMGIDQKLLAAIGIVSLDQQALRRLNYVGHLRAHLGIGEAARGYVAALIDAGVPTNLVDVSSSVEADNDSYDIVRRHGLNQFSASADVTIWHVNADQLPEVVGRYEPAVRSRRNIGIWAWETGEFPQIWHNRFRLVDEIWVGSHFMAHAVAPAAPCPVMVMPHVVEVPDIEPEPDWLRKSPDEFVFLTQFDYRSVVHRKNPEAAVAAFLQAFPGKEKVRLIVKSINASVAPDHFERMHQTYEDPRITFWDETLDTEARYRLLVSADCFISLHRAEGFGLSLAESMAYGKLVIATGWSGNLEFMDPSNSVLVPFELVPLRRSYGPYPAGTTWAEPEVAFAAAAMRRAVEDTAWRNQLCAKAKADIGAKLSPANVGARMLARLKVQASVRIKSQGTSPQQSRKAMRLLSNQLALATFAARNPSAGVLAARSAWRYYRRFGWRALWAKVNIRGFEIRRGPTIATPPNDLS